MAKQLGNKNIPKDIKIVGINVGEMPKDFSEELSPDISKAVTKAVRLVEEEVEKE